MINYHTIPKLCRQLRTDVLVLRLPIDLSAIETKAVRVASLFAERLPKQKKNRDEIERTIYSG
jgi:hypothetical protein